MCLGNIDVTEEIFFWDKSQVYYSSFLASEAMSASINYTWPPADATVGGQALLSDAAGVLSWGTPSTSAGHALLSGTHTDAASDAVTRGSLIIGNSTPEWDELVIGAANTFLKSDGTDPSWQLQLVTAPVTLTGATIGWDSTLIDGTTWSDGANATNTWTFDVSGTDHTMIAGDGFMAFSHVAQAANFAKTGWPRTPGVTIAFDDATKVLTVTDGGSAFYYIEGIKYVLGGNKTVDIDDVGVAEGLWFFHFVGSTLTASQTPWIFGDEDKAIVAFIYWDNTNNEHIICGNELHTFHMSGATHERLHDAGGTAFEDGLLVSGVAEVVNVAGGGIHDEDLHIEITDGAGAALFEQVLSPAEMPIFYRDGASNWRVYDTGDKANADDVGYTDAGDLKYNKLNGTWANANVPSANHVAYWVIATNDQTTPVALIMGQRFDTTIANAKENNQFAGLSLSGLPFEEMVALARLILKETGGGIFYTLDEVLDLRATNQAGNITTPLITDHGGLGGLGDDDHAQYTLHSLADAANDFLVASGNDAFAKKTLAEAGAILEGDIDHGNIQGLGDGSDHSFIDQSVVSGATPTLTATNFTGVSGITGLGTQAQDLNMGAFDIDGTDLDISAGTGEYSGGTIDGTIITATTNFVTGNTTLDQASLTDSGDIFTFLTGQNRFAEATGNIIINGVENDITASDYIYINSTTKIGRVVVGGIIPIIILFDTNSSNANKNAAALLILGEELRMVCLNDNNTIKHTALVVSLDTGNVDIGTLTVGGFGVNSDGDLSIGAGKFSVMEDSGNMVCQNATIDGGIEHTVAGATLGFHGTEPIVQQTLAADPTNAQISTVLFNLGFVKRP